jgi:hypothetical protein
LKREKDSPTQYYATTAVADGQGNFRLSPLPPGRYQARIIDDGGETGYTGEATEFEITTNNVSGVEVKVSQGATISGVVVIDGGAAAKNKFQRMSISPTVTPANAESSAASAPDYAQVNADGSFTIRGLPAGRVAFHLNSAGYLAPIKRIERDGVEIKDAIEVKPGDEITGVRIVLYQAQGSIRGQLQITGGALPDGFRLYASATRSEPAGESNASGRILVASGRISRSGLIDEKGRFVIEELPAGEYDLSIYSPRQAANGDWEASPLSNQRVTVSENGETPVIVTIDLNRIKQPNNRPNNQGDRR